MSKKRTTSERRPAAAEARKPKNHTFDCQTFVQGDQTLIMFSVDAKRLWTLTEVNQLEEDTSGGYQRAVSETRIRKISTFVDQGNIIPLSVLISFKHAKLNRDKTKITIENRSDAGWIIDGQHRILGGDLSKKGIELPVVGIIGLDVAKQAECFVTINKEQRGVPSSLYLQLLKELPKEKIEAKNATKIGAVDVANMLRLDDSSPFFGKIISTSTAGKGRLSLTNFVRKVQPLLKEGSPLYTFSPIQRCKIISNYYLGLREVFFEQYEEQESIFFKTIGFGALMGVLPEFFNLTITQGNGDFFVEDVTNTFLSIKSFDFSIWKGISGSGAEKHAAASLRDALLNHGKNMTGKRRIGL